MKYKPFKLFTHFSFASVLINSGQNLHSNYFVSVNSHMVPKNKFKTVLTNLWKAQTGSYLSIG